MGLQPIEKELLKLLAAEWENTGPPGYLETRILAEKLELPPDNVKSVIQSLFVRGLVDRDEVDTYAAYLTPEGYERARA